MDTLKGWKTVIFNVVTAVFGVLEVTDFTNIVPAQYQGWIISGVAMINLFLRMGSNTPIGRKE